MAGAYVNKAVLLCFFLKNIGGLMAGRPCKTLMDVKVSVTSIKVTEEKDRKKRGLDLTKRNTVNP